MSLANDLTELERLLAEATPGPWRFEGEGIRRLLVGKGEIIVCDPVGFNPQDEPFIVAVVNALPALLAERERLREAVVYLEGDVETLKGDAAEDAFMAGTLREGIAESLAVLPSARERAKWGLKGYSHSVDVVRSRLIRALAEGTPDASGGEAS